MNSFKQYILEEKPRQKDFTLARKKILLKLTPTSKPILFKVAQSYLTNRNGIVNSAVLHAFSTKIAGVSSIEVSPTTGEVLKPKGATFEVVEES